MGRRGPKPEPAAVKVAKGNPGRRRVGADPDVMALSGEVIYPKEFVVAPPVWLRGKALDVWNRLAPRLVKLKLLSAVDCEAFGRYCRNFARWEKMQLTLDKEGETYESESQHGKLKRAHPAFLISDRLERQLQAVEDRFGLNPAERQRLFAARAASPMASDLFGETPQPKPGKPGDDVQPKIDRPKSPMGLLN